MPITYPLDMSGTSQANYVENELHSVNEAQFRDYYFIVPDFSPFYVDNFKATAIVGGVSRPLVEDVDFSFALPYVTGTRTTGKAMYGAITLHNLSLNGLVSISYQTIGGNQVCDKLEVLTQLADKAYNPRTTVWDVITNVPEALPPVPHYQDYDTFYGQEQLVLMLGQVRDAIVANSSLTANEIRSFLSSIGTGQVGTGQVEGFLSKGGDQMQGPLLLSRDPLEKNEAATKVYIDTRFVSKEALTNALSNYMTALEGTTGLSRKLDLTGGTMTGFLELNAPPAEDMHPVNKAYLDQELTSIRDEMQQLAIDLSETDQNAITREDVMKLIGELSLRVANLGG